MRHKAIDRLFKRLGISTKNMSSFKLECGSRYNHLVTLDVTYLMEDKDVDDFEREFKSFILIEKPI